MKLSRTLISAGVLAILGGIASPALAQRHGSGGGGGPSHGSAVNRGGPRASAPRGGSVSRAYGAPRAYSGASRAYSSAPRAYANGPRAYASAPRGYASAPRGYSGVRGVAVPRGGGGFQRGFGSRFASVAPVRFFRPYYAFRPRLSLGFGLWLGYPITYPYAYYNPYYDPYAYGYPPPYAPYASYGYADPAAGYPPYPGASAYPSSASGTSGSSVPGSIDAQPAESDQPGQPAEASSGGLSFDITPSTAQVFVDGNLVGAVGQFTPTSQPLGLTPGRHRVEIRAPGYRTMTTDADIVAGQVIPYQGVMERQ
jgi:hypothetical protein